MVYECRSIAVTEAEELREALLEREQVHTGFYAETYSGSFAKRYISEYGNAAFSEAEALCRPI